MTIWPHLHEPKVGPWPRCPPPLRPPVDVVGNGKKRGFCGMMGTKTVLGWGKEVIFSHVSVKLPLDNFLYDLWKSRDDGDGTEVWGFGEATGFMDRMNDWVFPGRWEFTGCETGVDDVEQDMANGVKTELQNPDADAVRTTGSWIFHREKDRAERVERDRLQCERTGAHSGKPTREERGLFPVPDLTRDTRPHPDKIPTRLARLGWPQAQLSVRTSYPQ